MDLALLQVDKDEALDKYAEYEAVVANAKNPDPRDERALKTYAAILEGKRVVYMPAVITRGGFYESGFPKLAFSRADALAVEVRVRDGSLAFQTTNRRNGYIDWETMYSLPAVRLPERTRTQTSRIDAHASVPLIPPKLRPASALDKFYILWEAQWVPQVERIDPVLLKHVAGNFYEVVCMWDLTEIESFSLSA